MAQPTGTLVTFKADISPYMKGDTVRIDAAEVKRVDKLAKAREIETPYVKVTAPSK